MANEEGQTMANEEGQTKKAKQWPTKKAKQRSTKHYTNPTKNPKLCNWNMLPRIIPREERLNWRQLCSQIIKKSQCIVLCLSTCFF